MGKNLDVVRKMYSGEHPTQTKTKVGWTSSIERPKEFVARKVGDVWEETDYNGNTWVIRKIGETTYSRVSKGYEATKDARDYIDYLDSFPKCYPDCEKKETKNYTRIDKQVRVAHGMCLDCLSRYETALKVKGEFEQYEREKKLKNLIDLFKSADKERDIAVKSLSDFSITHETGAEEKWIFENKEQVEREFLEDYRNLKKIQLEPFKDMLTEEEYEQLTS